MVWDDGASVRRPAITTPAKTKVTPVRAIVLGFRKYVDFGGRATRAEYWWWWLFALIGGLVLGGFDLILGWGLFATLFALAILLPTSAMTSRRLHDIGKSGLWKLARLALGLVAGVLTYIATGDVPDDGIDSKILGIVLIRVDWMKAGTLVPGLPSAALAMAAWVIGIVGSAWVIAWLVRQGESGPNRFGPDPRA